MEQRSLRVAGLLTLSESRRAVVVSLAAPGALAGCIGSVPSGVAQLIGFAAPVNFFTPRPALIG